MALYLGNTKVKVKSGLARYTVVGSPTITNGIASNFSASNYLQLQQPIILNEDSIIEFKTKINLSTINTSNGIIGYPGGYYFHLIVVSDNKIDLFMGNGSSWTLLGGKKGTTVLSANTDYYIKIIINKGNVKCFLSTDDITYTTEFDVNITITDEYNYYIVYGRSRTDSQYLNGSIDLNETYIKINNNYFFRGSKQDILGYKVKYDNLFNGYYIIENGKLRWANPNIYIETDPTHYGGDGGKHADKWIDLGYKPEAGIEFFLDFILYKTEESVNNSFVFSSDNFALYGHWNNDANNGLRDFSDSTTTITMTRDVRHKLHMYPSTNGYITEIDKTIINTNTNTLISSTNNLILFAYNNSYKPYPSYSRIYSLKIKKQNTLLYHLVPVPKGLLIGNFVVPSNGMFDIVEQKFYENKGTGEFTIGGIPEDYIIGNGKLIWADQNLYLGMTGSQYIELNFKANQDTRVVTEFSTSDYTKNQCVFSSRESYGSNEIGTFVYAYNNEHVIRNNYNKVHTDTNILVTNDIYYKIDFNKNLFYVDGQLITTNTYVSFQATYNMRLGRTAVGTVNYFYGNLKPIQIYNYEKLVYYLVPVSTGLQIGSFTVPSNGMFDIVNQQFYANQGSGTFTYGKDS